MHRRLFAAATAGALALVALTGCRSDPSVAAYVDGTKITESQVGRMVDQARLQAEKDDEAAASQPDQAKPPEVRPSRSQVVGVLVTRKLTEQAVARQGLSVQQIDPEQVAGAFNVPAGTDYAAALTAVLAGVKALDGKVGDGYQPSDADLREVYDAAVAAGAAQPGAFDQTKPLLLQVQGLPQDLAVRNQLVQDASRMKVTVNPRYLPLQFPLETLNTQDGRSFVGVSLPLAAANGVVVDTTPTAAPTEQSAPDAPPQQ
jgi:hypothetical protein